jgi:hypothetical protein
MTSEQRTYVQAADIAEIEFECVSCSSRTSVPIASFKEPPIRCNVCNKQGQWLVPGSPEFMNIIDFVRSLKDFAAPEANGGQRFNLRFRVRPMP